MSDQHSNGARSVSLTRNGLAAGRAPTEEPSHVGTITPPGLGEGCVPRHGCLRYLTVSNEQLECID